MLGATGSAGRHTQENTPAHSFELTKAPKLLLLILAFSTGNNGTPSTGSEYGMVQAGCN